MRPDGIKQTLTRKHAAWVFHEMPEEPKLGGTELHRPIGAPHAMRLDVHFDVAVAQLLAGKRRANTPQHRPDAGEKLARAERLGHIIVGTGLEPADAVALLAARGEHDDRHLRRRTSAPQPPADLDPGDALDHPVEDYEIRRALFGKQQCFITVGAPNDVLA